MKAFVIKNKEGKYFVNRYVQAKKIYNAFIFEDKNDAEQVKGKDEEVVEITIAEGDLEKENKQLKEQLAEKYKQLEIYKNLELYNVGELLNENIKLRQENNTIRKQVCDEIREKLEMDEYNTCENTAFCVYLDYLKEILDQIEQTKENSNEHKSN